MPERRPEDYDRDFADIVAQIESARMPDPERGWLNLEESLAAAEPDEPSDDEWRPEPLPAPAPPSLVAGIGWACAAYAVAVVVLAVAGVHVPQVLAWLAVAAFLAAMGTGLSRLPRDRDPDDGDGAVL